MFETAAGARSPSELVSIPTLLNSLCVHKSCILCYGSFVNTVACK